MHSRCLEISRDVPRKQGYVLKNRDCNRSYLLDRNQPRRKRIESRLGFNYPYDEQARLYHEEEETIWESKESCTIVTANGTVTTTEEAVVCVKDLDMLITVQLLEDSPAFRSLGNYAKNVKCSYEWKDNKYQH